MSTSTALTYLAWTALITALMWVPYILDRIKMRGLIGAVGYPENPPPGSPWAERAHKAHINAVENLAVFAPLVLVAESMSVNHGAVAMAAQAYLWARIVHWIVYVGKVPWLRTLAFVVGWVCTVWVAWVVLF